MGFRIAISQAAFDAIAATSDVIVRLASSGEPG
jgi:hypothetical protein